MRRTCEALIAVVLCWQAVTTDRLGRPETIAAYSVVTAGVYLVGWTTPTADVPDPQPILVSGAGPVVPAPAPAPGTLCVPLPDDPPLNAVYFYRPEAEDPAGNWSCDPCNL